MAMNAKINAAGESHIVAAISAQRKRHGVMAEAATVAYGLAACINLSNQSIGGNDCENYRGEKAIFGETGNNEMRAGA